MWRTITAIAVSLVVPLMIEATGLATPRDHASHILIPAAISADGGNGTKFRSDIRITNLRGTPQLVVIYWLPAGVGGVERFELVELQSGETLESDDFVHEVLNASGLGAIGVGGLNEETDPDPNAMLHVTSRVWTPQPGTAGTSSQALAPIPVSDIESTHVFIKGHRRNEQYRTNVGIVNLDDADHHYLVTVSGEVMTLLPEEYSVTVPGESVIQIPTQVASRRTSCASTWCRRPSKERRPLPSGSRTRRASTTSRATAGPRSARISIPGRERSEGREAQDPPCTGHAAAIETLPDASPNPAFDFQEFKGTERPLASAPDPESGTRR
jgi:hypothetical protein